MNTLSPSSFLARLALRARRSKILVGLAAALAAPAVLFANSCSSDADYQSCHLEELHGNYLFTKDDVCGCEHVKCDPSTRCFHGDCCDPQLYANDHDRCGCAAACTAQEVCHDGLCCDPSSPAANSRTNCGCAGPCGDREDCQLDATGRYACVCDPILSLTDRDNCGCSGQACDPDTQRCRQGGCECDPLAGPTQQDDTNCACRGECPYVMEDGKKTRTAYCGGGICHCFSADEVICDGVCKKQSDCTCDPMKHMSDTSQCACNGPCAAGDSCTNGVCACDTIAHASDNLNCGCSDSPCDTANGYQCEQGTCACPAPMLSNNLNCGCSGSPCDTADGFGCSGGACVCPSERQTDPVHCGCPAVACDQGAVCVNGTCGQCVSIGDMNIQPMQVPGSGDTEFKGHGPVVTVTTHVSFDAAAQELKVHACVDMVETEGDWTHAQGCQDQILHNVHGSGLVSPADFMLKYTDNNHAPDDAMQKASSLLTNPVVLGVTCMGDTDGEDITPTCSGPFCSGCSLQFGCVVIAP